MTNLSPAAQAVLCAWVDQVHYRCGTNAQGLAAALRAAADQVGEWDPAEDLRDIAAELEAQP